MANFVGQVGCVTAIVALLIIGVAFGIGWFLDELMGNERRFMTVILLVASFPVTLYAMVRISLFMVGRNQNQVDQLSTDNQEQEQEQDKEESAS